MTIRIMSALKKNPPEKRDIKREKNDLQQLFVF